MLSVMGVRGLSRYGILIATLAALTAAAGCAPKAEVALEQRFAPPSQRNVALASEWSFHAPDGGRRSYLLAFSFPGSRSGPRVYMVYLNVPDRRGEWLVSSGPGDGARGFLIQDVGKLRGKAVLDSGMVRVSPVPLRPLQREIALDVVCSDGTRLRGKALAEIDPQEVRAFEHRYAADVARLAPPASQPAEGEEPRDEPATQSRSGARVP